MYLDNDICVLRVLVGFIIVEGFLLNCLGFFVVLCCECLVCVIDFVIDVFFCCIYNEWYNCVMIFFDVNLIVMKFCEINKLKFFVIIFGIILVINEYDFYIRKSFF